MREDSIKIYAKALILLVESVKISKTINSHLQTNNLEHKFIKKGDQILNLFDTTINNLEKVESDFKKGSLILFFGFLLDKVKESRYNISKLLSNYERKLDILSFIK